MLKNKIIVRKIRNIVILLMVLMIMLGAYKNIRDSRAENVIKISAVAIDNYGYLENEEFELEAKSVKDNLYEIELPDNVNTKKISEILKITLEDREEIEIISESEEQENSTEATQQVDEENNEVEEIVEIVENKIQLTQEQIDTQKINFEIKYDIAILEKNENDELEKILLTGMSEEDRAKLEITEETQMLYNKILRYENEDEDKDNEDKLVEVKGFLPIDAELQLEEVTQDKLEGILENIEIAVAYDMNIVIPVKTEIPIDEKESEDQPDEIIEMVEINPEDFGETYEVLINDKEIKEESQVYHIKEDNTYEQVNVKENFEESINFETKTFSIYAVGKEKIKETDENDNIMPGITTDIKENEAITTGDSSTTPYIPTGFTHVSGTSISNGYVVQDGSGNQFVWVQVPQTSTVYPTAGLNITAFTSAELTKIENDLASYSSDYKAWYATDTYSNFEEHLEMNEEQYNALKNKMLKSIYINGGFYIGRYETGISKSESYRYYGAETTTLLPTDETPVIQANTYVYNYLRAAQAIQLASRFAPNEDYISNLPFGLQWNLTMRHFEAKGIDKYLLDTDASAIANYNSNNWTITNPDASYTTDLGASWTHGMNAVSNSSVGNALLTTGASSQFSVMNIYDFAGNVRELTLEHGDHSEYLPMVARGGACSTNDNTTTGLSPYYNSYKSAHAYTGFRVVLYAEGKVTNDDGAPVWEKVSSTATPSSGTATITFKGTDDNFNASTLTSSNIAVYVNGSLASSGITKTLSSATNVTGTVNGTSKTIGKQYTLTLSGISTSATNVSIAINYGTLSDTFGNKNITTKMGVWSVLQSTATESGPATGFLGHPKIMRGDVQQVIFSSNISASGIPSMKDGLVRHYDGYNNIGSGHSTSSATWKDLSGNYDGTVNGGTFSSGGSNGTDNYLALDGTNDWVNLGNVDLTTNNKVTLDITFMPNTILSGEITLLANYESGGVGLELRNGIPRFEIGKTTAAGEYIGVEGTEALTAGQIYRIVGSYNGSTIKLYVNNKLVATTAYTGGISTPMGNTVFAIGANPTEDFIGGGMPYAKMRVYSAKIYNTALTNEVWDVSGNSWQGDMTVDNDYSIVAWTSQTSAPYTVYIGADYTNASGTQSIFANPDSTYLFACLGYNSVCTSKTLITNMGFLNTSLVTKMDSMFYYAGKNAMESLDLGSKFDTSKVTSMTSMFQATGYNAMSGLTGVSSMDTSKVTNMQKMFYECGYKEMPILTLDLDTSAVTNMAEMFARCGYTEMASLTLGSKFNTSKVTLMDYMFSGTGYMAMTTMNLGPNFDTSAVTSMYRMFEYTGYSAMTSLSLGSKFDTSKVTNMNEMFKCTGSSQMTTLSLGEKFSTTSATDMRKMFYETGMSAMTSLDLGPAFTKIPSTNTDMLTSCGKSTCVIYAPESIYSSRTALKLSKTSTTTISYSRGTINPKYRPQWTKEQAIVDTTAGTLAVTLRGGTNASGYTSNITSALTLDDIKVYIDGENVTSNITKQLNVDVTSSTEVLYTITLTNFEEAINQPGKSFNEWSGNVSLLIDGRGQSSSTYSKNILYDAYGNQSMSEIDTSGQWVSVAIQDGAVTSNTSGKMFIDIIKPNIKYEYAEADINESAKNIKVVFSVADKYFSSSSITVDNLTVLVGGELPGDDNGNGTIDSGETLEITKTLTSANITETVNGSSKTVGKLYTLTISNLDKTKLKTGKNYMDYSGVITVAIPSGKVADASGLTNNAKTITVGVSSPGGGYIPDGYTKVSGTVYSTGLVIQDSSGNQFVWVEVPKTSTVYKTAGLNVTSFTQEEYDVIEYDLQQYAAAYRTLYPNENVWVDEYPEEYVEDGTGLTSDEYDTLKKTMLKSVYKNGGFYIGRFETGTETARTESGETTQTPVIKGNVYPYNFVTTKQAQALSSENFSSNGYKSSLLFGIQWDLTMKYLETKGATTAELNENSSAWGNYTANAWNITNTSAKYYYNNTWTNGAYGQKSAGTSILLSTGATNVFSKQRIFDLAGNVAEHTLEYPGSTSLHVRS